MSKSRLLRLVQDGDYGAFDTCCLELLTEGKLGSGDLAEPIEALRAAGEQQRVVALGPMVFENLNWDADPLGNIELAKALIACDPQSNVLRERLCEAYRRAYGDRPGFAQILAASGLETGRAYRVACNILDLGMTLEVGDFLVNRMDDHAVEVAELDRPNGLFTLHREARKTTIPAAELARNYDRVDRDDFRVLRQLQPERLVELIEHDPVALVTGLLHSRGEHIDQDMLRDELVPRHLDAKAWTKWWTKTRAKLKRAKHINMEGRAPVILSWCAEGQTVEDVTLEAFERAREPGQWLKLIETYLREKAGHKEPPDADLLESLHARLLANAEELKQRHPSDALGAALIISLLAPKGLPATEESRSRAAALLRASSDPVKLIARLDDAALWQAALTQLRSAYPDDSARYAAQLMGTAPGAMLDRLAQDAIAGGELNAVQTWIERALDDPVQYPDIMYWLWRGPQDCEGLRVHADEFLLSEILDTLYALGRSLTPDVKLVREFRQRMRAALALRRFDKVSQCFAVTDYGRAVTLKRQIERIEGLGETTLSKLLDLLRDRHPALWVRPAARRLEAWEDENIIYATEAGIARRTAERDEILNVKMRENAKRIGDAASLGDLSENSEYTSALEERDFLRAQLANINNELSLAVPIEPRGIGVERIEIGTCVTLRNLTDGSEQVITFLGPFDADFDRGIYNYRAPVAQKLMGLGVGERVAITIDGREVEFEVLEIASALEHSV